MATVVFFHAHPDDEALATAGTMARMADEGHRVVLVVATRGEEGEPVSGVLADGEALGDRRSTEVEAAAGILGTARVAFLGYRDSGMVDDPANAHPDCFWQADVDEAAARLADLLVDEDPDLIVIYDPNGGYGHPDHIQVHRVGGRWAEGSDVRVRWVTLNRDVIRDTIEAAMAESAASGEAVDETLAERRERAEQESFGTPSVEITHRVEVAGVLDRKRAAIVAHASQIAPDSFFVTMPDEHYRMGFGAEWFVDPNRPRGDGEPFRDDLLLA